MIGLGLSIPEIAARRSGYDPVASAYFAAMTVQEPMAVKDAINAFVTKRRLDGSLARIERMIIGLGTEQASLVDLVQPAKTAVNFNAAAFTPYRGFTGNASTAYIGFSDNMDVAALFKQNDCSAFVYCNLQIAPSGQTGHFGDASAATTFGALISDNATFGFYRLNSNVTANFANIGTRTGSKLITRSDASNMLSYSNGSADSIVAAASVAINAAPFVLLRRASVFGRDRIWAGGYGAGFTQAQALAFQADLHVLATALGANY